MRLGLKESGTPRLAVVFTVLALLILAGTLVFAVLGPAYGDANSPAARAKNRRAIQKQTATATERAATSEAYASAHLSTGDQHGAAARVMAALETMARRHGLKVTAFRPQRTRVVDDLLEMPFVAHVTGSYPAVHKLLHDLDGSGTRLVLRSVQLAAAEETPGDVTAVVGLTTYTAAPKVAKGKAK